MKKRYISISIFLTLLLLTGCSRSIQSNQDDLDKNFTKEAVSIELKEKCSVQASKTLNEFKLENADSGYNSYSQKNHYNKKMNQCFVYITYKGSDSRSYWYLKDAFENTDLAGCKFFSGDVSNSIAAHTCFIEGGPAALSQEEIDDFVEERMENK